MHFVKEDLGREREEVRGAVLVSSWAKTFCITFRITLFSFDACLLDFMYSKLEA